MGYGPSDIQRESQLRIRARVAGAVDGRTPRWAFSPFDGRPQTWVNGTWDGSDALSPIIGRQVSLGPGVHQAWLEIHTEGGERHVFNLGRVRVR